MSARVSSVSASSPSLGNRLIPYSHGDADSVTRDSTWSIEGCYDFLRGLAGVVRIRELRQDHHELVPAVPAYGIGTPHAHGQVSPDRLEQFVADGMSVHVVDGFEAVDRKAEDRQRSPVTARECQRPCQVIGQPPPVW